MYIDETVNGHFELLSKVVSEILAAKALYGIPNKKSVERECSKLLFPDWKEFYWSSKSFLGVLIFFKF